jgi:hypothetical protein
MADPNTRKADVKTSAFFFFIRPLKERIEPIRLPEPPKVSRTNCASRRRYHNERYAAQDESEKERLMNPLDDILKSVLDTAENAEKRFKQATLLVGLVEVSLLVTFLLVMDFGQRLHWLLLIAAVLTYGTVAAGLVMMGAFINMNTFRVLKAIELIDRDDDH